LSILNVLQPLLADFVNSIEGKETAKDFGNYLINGETIPRKSRSYTKLDIYKNELFSGFMEIYNSFQALRDIEIIVSGLTTRQSKISKTRLFSYHIHNYLNENYILEKRLEQFPVKFLRSSKRWDKSTRQLSEKLNEMIFATFKNINTIRGKHVHSTRYSDSELDRLFMLERAITYADHRLQEPLLKLFKIEFAMSRRQWADKIRNNNDEVEKLLDQYFLIIHPLVFDKHKSIIF
jgi:hypothetical protein